MKHPSVAQVVMSVRRFRERRRDALETLGEGMRDWISSAHMVALDGDRRFVRPLHHWPLCRKCGVPMAAFPHSNFREWTSPVFTCTLCDLRWVDACLRSMDRCIADLDPLLACATATADRRSPPASSSGLQDGKSKGRSRSRLLGESAVAQVTRERHGVLQA